MRSLEVARESWQELQQYSTLRDLKDAVRLESNSSAATAGLRSVCWKTFLLFDDTLESSEWLRILAASRSAYNSLRQHFFRFIDNPDDVGASFDPLSQDAESSPWAQVHKDEELRAEILQDVERCMPETPYFRQPETQRILLDVLFIFCKLNPDVGYRQGMHEIAAPILWTVENDAIDIGEGSKTMGEDSTIKAIFDADHIEHDTFAIFGQVMQSAKTFYLSEGPVSIAARSRHIFDELLPQVDPELKKHLEGLDIPPQVFLIRWIRLLFGREFDFDNVLALWDVIFAEDTSLELVDHICLAMLLRIRWHLLDADYNGALSLLLRYPEQDKDFPAQTFGLDAIYLRNHMNKEGGSYLVLKYTGRPLSSGRPTTPPALQRNITTFSGLNAARKTGLSPPRTPAKPRNIEAILQNTAKNIYARGEKLGIGKAVRNAVDEVHKKAQEIRDSQTPSTPPWRRPGTAHSFEKLKHLELRNKRLAELLSGAVNELWEYQKLVTEDEKGESRAQETETVEKLSTAIAKVQFVQVYLEEPSLALPSDDAPAINDPDSTELREKAIQSTSSSQAQIDPELAATTQNDTVAAHNTRGLADPDTFEDFSELNITSNETQSAGTAPRHTETHTAEPNTPERDAEHSSDGPGEASAPRPRLEQSQFSFMLGQGTSEDMHSAVSTPPQPQKKTHASLFGEEEGNRSTSRTPSRKANESPFQDSSTTEGEFDMGSLRRAKGSRT
ncbi:hypothetical protein PRZ48_001521 [Zasmidium cellare]|uniref:Rab-GAP TBC domain-containing protein n=1 Tax=Zasmidium cellare TaxID=395010 RepID=A0ABR0F364_ZASCE|nr:hypothetical protein PRZ48_001521 [Zasmidium cellare]